MTCLSCFADVSDHACSCRFRDGRVVRLSWWDRVLLRWHGAERVASPPPQDPPQR